jgi:hypothetical protein
VECKGQAKPFEDLPLNERRTTAKGSHTSAVMGAIGAAHGGLASFHAQMSVATLKTAWHCRQRVEMTTSLWRI